ncbi:MAG: hypothetical protein AAGU16_08015, partial [Desulfitobacterium hafniense]
MAKKVVSTRQSGGITAETVNIGKVPHAAQSKQQRGPFRKIMYWLVSLSAIGSFGFAALQHFSLKKEQPLTTIKSHNQSGGITAGTVNIMPQRKEVELSEASIEKIVKRVQQSQDAELKTRYDEYRVFGISAIGIIVPKGEIPHQVEVNWPTSKIMKFDHNKVIIRLPDMIFPGNTIFIANEVIIPKELGFIDCSSYSIRGWVIFLEILAIEKGNVVAALG